LCEGDASTNWAHGYKLRWYKYELHEQYESAKDSPKWAEEIEEIISQNHKIHSNKKIIRNFTDVLQSNRKRRKLNKKNTEQSTRHVSSHPSISSSQFPCIN
jgi:hypothetical protein